MRPWEKAQGNRHPGSIGGGKQDLFKRRFKEEGISCETHLVALRRYC